MKNKIAYFSLIVLCIFIFINAQSIAANQEKKWSIKLNGKSIRLSDNLLLNKSNQRIYVPLRDIHQHMGATVHADVKSKTIYLTNTPFDSLSTREVDAWGRLVRNQRLPQNAKDFPYLLKKYDNEFYELKYVDGNRERFLSPRDIYAQRPAISKQYLDRMMDALKEHYMMILNADYKQMTDPDDWAIRLFSLRSQGVNQTEAIASNKRYAKWVIANQIRMKGEFDPEPSMIYFSGNEYYVRCSFSIEVLAFRENKNVLHDIAYDWNKFEKNRVYKGFADIALDKKHDGKWESPVRVSIDSSLFLNSKIKKI